MRSRITCSREYGSCQCVATDGCTHPTHTTRTPGSTPCNHPIFLLRSKPTHRRMLPLVLQTLWLCRSLLPFCRHKDTHK